MRFFALIADSKFQELVRLFNSKHDGTYSTHSATNAAIINNLASLHSQKDDNNDFDNFMFHLLLAINSSFFPRTSTEFPVSKFYYTREFHFIHIFQTLNVFIVVHLV